MTKDEQIKGMANPNRGSVGVQEAQLEQEPCDMGVMCAGCTPRNLDGSCPAAQPEPVQTRAVHITWNSDGIRTVNGVPDYTPPAAQRKPLTNGEIYTAYITATNQTLRPQDERLAFAFARAIEAAHGIKEKNK